MLPKLAGGTCFMHRGRTVHAVPLSGFALHEPAFRGPARGLWKSRRRLERAACRAYSPSRTSAAHAERLLPERRHRARGWCCEQGIQFHEETPTMSLQPVTCVSLWLSGASFVAFVLFAFLGLRGPRPQPRAALAAQPQAGLPDLVQLAEALARLAESLGKFAESLAKAGPAISALVASIVFMLIALAAAGLVKP